MKLVNVFLVAGLAGCSFALNINPPECAVSGLFHNFTHIGRPPFLQRL